MMSELRPRSVAQRSEAGGPIPRRRVDDQAALAELERLLTAIQRARMQREQAKPFSGPGREEVPTSAVPAGRTPVPSGKPAARPRPRAYVRLLVVAGAIIVGVLLLSLWLARRPAPATPSPPASTPTVRSQVSQGVASGAPTAPDTAPPDVGLVRVSLETMRPVWLRVIVDDRKTLERELPANQHLDFTAEKAIVIRAGDAGAIRLRLSGEDRGTLGEDGQVVTRRFMREN